MARVLRECPRQARLQIHSRQPRTQPRQHGATSTGLRLDPLGVTVRLAQNTGADHRRSAERVAALAGLHVGDVINAVDGKPVHTPMELAAELENRPTGDKVRLGYMLHGAWQTETVVLLGALLTKFWRNERIKTMVAVLILAAGCVPSVAQDGTGCLENGRYVPLRLTQGKAISLMTWARARFDLVSQHSGNMAKVALSQGLPGPDL